MIEISRTLNEASLRRVQQVAALKPGAHVHISGICGTGMASVLQLLKKKGFYVSGSDKSFYPPMGELVRKLADVVYEGYSAENIKARRPELIVIGNALSRDNPEVKFTEENALAFANMPEVFAALLIETREEVAQSIVVTGTHGKTTTTAAVSCILDSCGLNPGFFIGGLPSDFSESLRLVDKTLPLEKRCVVLEGDEYDSAFFAKYSKFHSYRPDIVIVSSLEFDHADIFKDLSAIKDEFNALLTRVPETGLILACEAASGMPEIIAEWKKQANIKAKICTYGDRPEADLAVLHREVLNSPPFAQELRLKLWDLEISSKTKLSGAYNAWNILAAAAVAKHLRCEPEKIAAGISRFSGVRRRQQEIYNANDIIVVEDFAHHPKAVELTIQGLKEKYRSRRLIVAFEPRSNTSRQNIFQDEYAKSFRGAEIVLIPEISTPAAFSSVQAKNELKSLDVPALVSELGAKSAVKQSHCFKTVAELEAHLLGILKPGDLLVLMSNGDFSGLPERLSKM